MSSAELFKPETNISILDKHDNSATQTVSCRPMRLPIVLPTPKAATLHLGYCLHWPVYFISSQLSVAISEIEIVEDKVACITRQARLDSQL
ncbi:hypothetical protein BT96DRAFT_1002461 [Gymnopus androsaceus JB14]|uniref:Uncharacterized protein n=1 Tax=Gymnopus androsaceus JB14 TaxID=1447944 RepID=A0A6A4GYS9_9AGAR|nr:hypothetical protein BT96DRAFT_1002461 [Gymnopus androsaceus JB14]